MISIVHRNCIQRIWTKRRVSAEQICPAALKTRSQPLTIWKSAVDPIFLRHFRYFC